MPRETVEDVLDADWAPDGQSLAVARWIDGKCRLEFPLGKPLYESDDAILTLRVSRDGERVAFLQAVASHGYLTNTFLIGVVDRSGRHRELSRGWWLTGMAWSPSGRELWFGVPDQRGGTELRAVTLSGQQRLVARFPGFVGFADLSRQGQALIIDDNGRFFVFARAPGETLDRNLSFYDDSKVTDISSDGRTLLLSASNLGGGRDFGVYLRRTDGSSVVRLGDGFGYGLSPDGRWVLSFRLSGVRLEFMLLPTGAGAAIRIADGLPASFHGASWLPDSQSFVFSGSSTGEPARLYLQDIAGGKPRPVTPPGADLRAPCVSADGRLVAALDSYNDIVLSGLDGSPSRPLDGADEDEVPIQWSADGRTIYVYRPSQRPVRVFGIEVASGRRRLWKEITISDPNGIDGNVVVAITPDGRSYAYSLYRGMAKLMVVDGLK
jgi:Tol biopolymer transport system component